LADVAERVFLKHGFSDTTMQMIAREARASKETLYRHFVCKETLFSEIMRNRAMRIFGASGGGETDAPPEDLLFRVGHNLLQTMIRPDSLALFRAVIAESPRAPELGRLFWSQGPTHVQEQLTAYLAALTSRGILACGDPALACRLFLGAVIADHHALALITGNSADEEAIQMHVRQAVAMFLARYSAAPKS
jgi:AcrR family transcriptional regulator